MLHLSMKNFLSISVMLIVFFIPISYASSEYFGEYQGSVKAEWIDERKMKLLSNFSFTDPNGMIWLAKQSSVIDGASIPSFAWVFIGSPFVGKYREASVIHDIACDEKIRTWESVHLAFYYAMRASGVGTLKAKIMYAAVYHGGPRWPIIRKVLIPVPEKEESWWDRLWGNSSILVSQTPLPPEYKTEVIEPMAKSLNQEELESLINLIKKNESSLSPMPLEDIRVY